MEEFRKFRSYHRLVIFPHQGILAIFHECDVMPPKYFPGQILFICILIFDVKNSVFIQWSCSSQGEVEEEEEEEEDSFFCWSFSLTKQSNAVLNMIYFFQVRPLIEFVNIFDHRFTKLRRCYPFTSYNFHPACHLVSWHRTRHCLDQV